jgi:hypothetical protein
MSKQVFPGLSQLNEACLASCNACADACDHCAIACLQEGSVEELTRCVALDLDCAALRSVG